MVREEWPTRGYKSFQKPSTKLLNIKERWWEAELFRLKGVLLLQQTKPDLMQAEASFYQALDAARRQHSISLELRAVISLYRLGQQQGKRQRGQSIACRSLQTFLRRI